jgi:hypothetical protein
VLYTVDEGHVAVAGGFGLVSVVAFAVADSDSQPGSRATVLHAGWVVAVVVDDPQPAGLPRRSARPGVCRRAADGGGGAATGHRGFDQARIVCQQVDQP